MTFQNVVEATLLTTCIAAIIYFRFGRRFSAKNRNSMLSRLIYILKVLIVLGLILSTLSVYQDGYWRFLRDLPNSLAFGIGFALWSVWPVVKLGDEIHELVSRKQDIGFKVTLKGLGESILVSILASVGFVFVPNLFQYLFQDMFRFSAHYLSGSGNFGGLLAPLWSVGLIAGYSVLSFALQMFFKLKGDTEVSRK